MVSLETSISKNRYVGDGKTVTYAFTFKAWETDHIRVIVGDGKTEEDVTGSCSVSLNDTTGGGTVTFAQAPAAGVVIVIMRRMPFIQEDRYITGTRFDPHEIEDRFDQDCAERQELREELDRAVKLPVTGSGSPGGLLSWIKDAADRACECADRSCECAQLAQEAADRIGDVEGIISGAVNISTMLTALANSIDLALSSLGDFYAEKTQIGTFSRMPAVMLSAAEGSAYNQFGYIDGVYKREDLVDKSHRPVLIIIAGGSDMTQTASGTVSGLPCEDIRVWDKDSAAWVDAIPVGGPDIPVGYYLRKQLGRPVYILNVARMNSLCSPDAVVGTNGTWASEDIRSAVAAEIMAAMGALNDVGYDLLGTIWQCGVDDSYYIYRDNYTVEQFKTVVSGTWAWLVEVTGVSVFAIKCQYRSLTTYDPMIDDINTAIDECIAANKNAYLASSLPTTFRSQGLLTSSSIKQNAHSLLGNDVTGFMAPFEGVSHDIPKRPVVIITAGQSNALRSYSQAPSTVDVTGIYNWWQNAHWYPVVQDSIGGFEPILARVVSDYKQQPVYLINVAVGGANCAESFTRLNDDGTPYPNWSSAGTTRYEAVMKVKKALRSLENDGIGYTLLGLIWMQGESDALYIQEGWEQESDYRHSVEDTLNYLKTGIGTNLYIVKVGQYQNRVYDNACALVNSVLTDIANTTDGISIISEAMVSSRDDGYLVDSIHINQEGQDILGADIAHRLKEVPGNDVGEAYILENPLAFTDPELVGCPWGFSKEDYLGGLQFVLNAGRIYGFYDSRNPGVLGYGFFIDGKAEAKWQGNTTLVTAKKSFTIKLDKKVEVVPGWGKLKKYVVKNNIPNGPYSNLLCARLWGDMVRTRSTSPAFSGTTCVDSTILEKLLPMPNCGAVDGFPVNYVINGNYYGLGSFNLPKDENLFGMKDIQSACIFTAGSNERQIWNYIKSAAASELMNEGCTSESLIAAMVGNYDTRKGCLGLIRNWTASPMYIYPTFESNLRKYLGQVDRTDITNLFINVEQAVRDGLDKSLARYRDKFAGLGRDPNSVSSFYGWNSYHDRTAGAKWLRARFLELLGGIVNAFGLGLKAFTQGVDIDALTEDFLFSETDATLFQGPIKCVNDAFETEYIFEDEDGIIDAHGVELDMRSRETVFRNSVNALIASVLDGSDLVSVVGAKIDLASVIDMMVLIFATQDIDQLRNNYILASYDGQKWFLSAYDMNQNFIAADAGFKVVPATELSLGIDSGTYDYLKSHALYRRILETPETLTIFKARWAELRATVLSDFAVNARLANITNQVSPQAYEAEVRRWPMYGYHSEVWDSEAVMARYRMQVALCDAAVNSLTA